MVGYSKVGQEMYDSVRFGCWAVRWIAVRFGAVRGKGHVRGRTYGGGLDVSGFPTTTAVLFLCRDHVDSTSLASPNLPTTHAGVVVPEIFRSLVG